MLQADPVDVAAGGRAGLVAEGAGEVARGEAGAGGERLHGQVVGRVLGDPALHLPQGIAAGGLRGELGAELGLVARPAQEHHQVAGDGQGGVPVQVLLDQGQREVDARGDAGRGGDVAVTDVDGVRLDRDGRVVAGQLGAVAPVGGDPAAVQQARPGQQDRPRADRDQAPGPGPCARSHAVSSGSGARVPSPPGTSRVCGSRAPVSDPSGTRVSPLEVRTGAPSREAVRMRYVPGVCRSAPAKTSRGPVTSRLCTPSKRTRSTVRWGMPRFFGRGGHGRNDGFPTFPAVAAGAWRHRGHVRPGARYA